MKSARQYFHPFLSFLMMRLFASDKNALFPIRAQVQEFINGDLLIVVEGGVSHIGAVGLSLPRPSISSPGQKRASTSLFTVLGHRDDEIVNEMSDLIVAATGRTVVVVAGLHFPELKREDIGLLQKEWQKLARQIGKSFKTEGKDV